MGNIKNKEAKGERNGMKCTQGLKKYSVVFRGYPNFVCDEQQC